MKVGIVIPYKVNRGWLKDAVHSVENQTYKAGEIRLVQMQSDSQVGENINKGAEVLLHEQCDLIRYLCEDDMLTANSVEDTVRFFQDNPDIDFIHSNAITRFQKTGEQRPFIPEVKHPTLQQMVAVNRLHGGTVTYRAKCFEATRFDPDLWTGEEYDFNMKLLAYGYKLGYLNEFTYIYRRHSNQKSLGNTAQAYQNKRREQIETIKNRYR